MKDGKASIADQASVADDGALRTLPRSLAPVILAVIGLVGALYFARGFLVPLLIGILLSYTLSPLVDRLQSRSCHARWLRRWCWPCCRVAPPMFPMP